jgi:hypothetical protein
MEIGTYTQWTKEARAIRNADRTAPGLADIADTFSGFGEDLEARATHAPQQREREILRARAAVWREAAKLLRGINLEERSA